MTDTYEEHVQKAQATHQRILDEVEQKRYEAAQKISLMEYDGFIFAEGYKDEYFRDLEELFEYCVEVQMEAPKYVYCCSKMDMGLDASTVLEGSMEVGWGDIVSSEQVEELQMLLDGWVRKHGIYELDVDYTRVIDIPEEAREGLLAEVVEPGVYDPADI